MKLSLMLPDEGKKSLIKNAINEKYSQNMTQQFNKQHSAKKRIYMKKFILALLNLTYILIWRLAFITGRCGNVMYWLRNADSGTPVQHVNQLKEILYQLLQKRLLEISCELKTKQTLMYQESIRNGKQIFFNVLK